MRKLDKLVLSAFVGPFILTFLVVVFILLMQHMLKYFDDIIGKDLGWDVLGQLLFYFAVFMTPVALPLAVLLSSLIAFGNLGEHFELTAIKASGISLIRTLQPIFIFVIFLTGVAFYANNYLVPKAALEAYSLLYDIKQKKPALELREGAFYNGIPDISIKVNEKFPKDPDALKGIIVYDHRKNDGNKEVTVADSGRMSTIMGERYLKFELYNGYNYTEGASDEREMTGNKNTSKESLTRSKFDRTEVVFDLSSYDLKRTDKKWFEGNRIMRNLTELESDIDSINGEMLRQELNHYSYKPSYFGHYLKNDSLVYPAAVHKFKLKKDSIDYIKEQQRYGQSVDGNLQKNPVETVAGTPPVSTPKTRSQFRDLRRKNKFKMRDSLKTNEANVTLIPSQPVLPATNTIVTDSTISEDALASKWDSLYARSADKENVQSATNVARQVKSQLENTNSSVDMYIKELAVFEIQWHKIIASSMACIAMFLIGAPLGSIIKRGGLGVPFLVSIFFFIVYYLLSMQGEKLAKQGALSAMVGVWLADLVLLIVGLFFLRQARIDARLFEADFYKVVMDKVKRWISGRKLAYKAANQ
jgi:lipopolysaccharide export system permease protein